MSGETKHSHEPWTLQPTNRYGRVRLMAGENGPTIAIIEGAHPSDLLRLVACVNACAGIPADLLEAMAPGRLRTLTEGWGGDWERRVRAALAAVESIPTAALEAGALAMLIEGAEKATSEGVAGGNWKLREALRALGRRP